jgi:hypothetical protein
MRSPQTYFSLAMRSLLIRSLASEIFESTYCVTKYPTPTTPIPIARGVLFRRNHLRVAAIMAYEISVADITFRLLSFLVVVKIARQKLVVKCSLTRAPVQLERPRSMKVWLEPKRPLFDYIITAKKRDGTPPLPPPRHRNTPMR